MALDWCYIYRGSIKVLKEDVWIDHGGERERERDDATAPCMHVCIDLHLHQGQKGFGRKPNNPRLLSPRTLSLLCSGRGKQKASFALVWWCLASIREACIAMQALSLSLSACFRGGSYPLRGCDDTPFCLAVLSIYRPRPTHTVEWAWPHAMLCHATHASCSLSVASL